MLTLETLEASPLYSEELGIDLSEGTDAELFKWFLASILFGSRITQTIAMHTYKAFEKYDLLTPKKILDAGWDFLVNPIMWEGGYVRYDGRKSEQILRDCEFLLEEYGGSLNRMHETAADSKDLEKRVDAFYGVGIVTTNIFLRELRPFWEKADPEPLEIVWKEARKLHIDLRAYDRKSVLFVRIEAGLIRHKNEILEKSSKDNR